MNTYEYLDQFYEKCDEHGRLTSRYGQVEYLTTMHYIQRYLFPGARILEIGAATGRYSHALAQAGYQVDAVELLERNIRLFKAHTQPGEKVTIIQGNAVDLSVFPDNTYDLTLLLGPMYHLYDDEDKGRALSEALWVTRPGGVLFAAYCMAEATLLTRGFQQGMITDFLEQGILDPVTFETTSTPKELFELHRTEDILALRSKLDAAPLHFLATDGYSIHMQNILEEMDGDMFQLFIRYHLATCERMDMIGYSHHSLDILRKN